MSQEDGTPGRRGRLSVYLGAAPGVGKTYAMLDEAHRRSARGTDVVVGIVETHGRARTAERLEGIEVLPRRTVSYRGVELGELDVDAILARRPAVVLVDELAHTNAPGSRHAKRVDDVEEIRAAGIDVITTVNVQHLESLNDDVEQITGIRQRETVPDALVREADQIQLVDMSPEALRRRLAHGNVYTGDRIDASLTSYFRVGNLTALRELALLWLADRVDDALDDYRRDHRIGDPWPARERVLVAVTGGPESETLIRRGARIAQRAAGSELMAVHVIAADGLAGRATTDIVRLSRLVADLDGTFHTAVGEDVARAVTDFARGANATMIVVGVSRNGRLRNFLTGSTGSAVARLADPIDVHLVTHEEASGRTRATVAVSPLARNRLLAGWVSALVAPLLLTALLRWPGGLLGLPTDVLLFLAMAVAVALVGGRWPALFAAASGFLLLNWFFVPPVGRLTISDPENALALVVFLVVAASVAAVVDLAARRTAEARRARAEAATLSSLSRSVLGGEDTAQALVERLRETFGLTAVDLVTRFDSGWAPVAHAGEPVADDPGSRIDIDDDRALVLYGRTLPAADRQVVEAFATQAGLVLEYRRLRERAARAQLLEGAEESRASLLGAVSADLLSPVADIRASVDLWRDGPRPEQVRDLVRSVETATRTLEQLVDNLNELARLQSGTLVPQRVPTRLAQALTAGALGLPPAALEVDLADDLPSVETDADLLARVVANLARDAVRHAPAGRPARLTACARPGFVDLFVVDQGPPRTPGGPGVWMAVVRGLGAALGAEIAPEDTPGGGLTMVVTLPRVEETAEPPQGAGEDQSAVGT